MKLIEQIRQTMRPKHHSLKTERNYINWVIRYIRFHKLQHPKELNESHVTQFSTHLASKMNVSASTQNQTFNALIFLYKNILKIELKDINAVRAKQIPPRSI